MSIENIKSPNELYNYMNKNIPYNLKFVDYINEIINNSIEYKIK